MRTMDDSGVVCLNSIVVICLVGTLLLLCSGCQEVEKPDFTLGQQPEHVHDLKDGEPCPSELAGEWQRLRDGQRFEVTAGSPLKDLAEGAYQHGEHRICIRHGDDIGSRARSLLGISSTAEIDTEQVVDWAEQRERLNPVSLIVLSWRLQDYFTWPWQTHVGFFDGIAQISARHNPTKAGFQFSREQGVYVDASDRPIAILADAMEVPAWGEKKNDRPIKIALGDLISAVDSEGGAARFGILVEDKGKPGFLDPADKLISAFVPPTREAKCIEEWQLGFLLGPEPLHIYTRHEARARSILQRYRPDNPIWQLSPARQWMTLGGLLIVIIVLIRHGRRLRRRN